MELSFVQRQNLKICHCGCCWSIERKRDVGKKALAIFFPGTQEKKSPPQHGRQWHSLTMGPIVKAKREDEEKKFGMYKYMDHHRVNLQIWMIHLTLEHCGPPPAAAYTQQVDEWRRPKSQTQSSSQQRCRFHRHVSFHLSNLLKR